MPFCGKSGAGQSAYRHPLLSAGLAAVADGLIGRPVSGYLSLVHDYHAASILRKMLLTDGEGYTLRGERTVSHVVETDSRYGAFYDGRTGEEVRDTQALRDIRRTWQPELQTDAEHDEFAIATMLLDMEDYLAGGLSPYPLEDALDDALFWILIRDAVSNPGREIHSPRTPRHTR